MPRVYSTTHAHSTSKPTYIYGLFEASTNECRYVGKTIQSIHRRYQGHLSDAIRRKKYPVQHWIAKRVLENTPPILRLLEEVPAGQDWIAREQFWIRIYREQGHFLLNLTDGGEGLPGLVYSPERNAKISKAHKTGMFASCLSCGKPVWRKRHDFLKGHQKYCSRACFAASLKGMSRPMPPTARAKGIKAAALAKKARQFCPNGHLFSPENTRHNKKGARICKTCERFSKQKYLQKNKAQFVSHEQLRLW